jgi:ERCC4-type nuclease
MQLQIIIDDREKAVIPFFKEYNVKKVRKSANSANVVYKVERINIGDYSIICGDQILFNIERKTWKDLASSFKDGRKDNVQKMLKLREDTHCKLIYLMEGPPIPKSTSRFCRIPYKNLRSHLDHLMFKYDIHIIHSKNKMGTVSKIYELCQNFFTIKPSLLKIVEKPNIDEIYSHQHENPANTTGGAITKLKEKFPISQITIIYRIWACIPYITEKTACLFVNKHYHISDLILGKISKDDVYALKYDNGYIIGKRSTKIWNNSRPTAVNNKYFAKMLIQINGITRKTANIILKNISWENLLKGEITIETLAKIIKNDNGKKVGVKIATDILKTFIKII